MDLRLAGMSAVVVGGARGIGRSIAEAFAAEQAAVTIVDASPEGHAAALQMAEQFQTPAAALVHDVASYDEMTKAAEATMSRQGRIDHIIFAVGIGSGKYGFPFWNLEPGDWERVLRVNVIGAANIAHAFAPYLIEARSGTMLFIASVAGQIGSQTDPPYSASKAALINFAQCAAKDLAPFHVRVNSLCPGMVKTVLNRSIWEAWNRLQPAGQQRTYEDWADEKVRRVVPLGRWQDAEDIARMAVFLASDCAKNITGQTINVDGGFVMHW